MGPLYNLDASSIPDKVSLFERFRDGECLGVTVNGGTPTSLRMWRICWEDGSGESWMIWAEGAVGSEEGRFILYCNTSPDGRSGHAREVDDVEYFGH